MRTRPSRKRRGRASTAVTFGAAFGLPLLVVIALLVWNVLAPRRPNMQTFAIAAHPSAAAFVAGELWVTDDASDVVRSLDPDTGRERGAPVRVSHNPVAIAARGRDVWVGHADGNVVRVDARARTAGPPIRAGTSITGVAVGGGFVWAANLPGDEIVGIDPSTSSVRRRIHVAAGAVRVLFARGVLWVAGRERVVTRVDPTTGAAVEVGVGAGPLGMAYDGALIWVANSDDGTVSRIDAASARVIGTAWAAGRGPVAVEIWNKHAVVADQDAGAVSILDVRSGERRQVAIAGRASLRAMAYGGGAVFVVGSNPGTVVRVVP